MTHPDAVVVGAGIVGCSIAYELAKDGRRVVVVEKGDIGREASWAAAGILTPIHLAEYPAPLVELCLEAQRDYPRILSELKSVSDTDLEYRTIGMLMQVRDDEDARAVSGVEAWRKAHGEPCERTSDGLLLPNIGQVRNHRLTRVLAEAATKRGVEFRTNSPVTGFLRVPGRVNGVRTSRGDLQAGTTILAAGCWAGEEAARLGIRLPVRPVRGQLLMVQTPPGTLPHMILHKGRYLVPRADGTILIGSTAEEAGFDKSVTVSGARELLERGIAMLPALKDAPLLASWAGLRPATPDRLPFLGPVPGYDGLILATGHFRNGILLGPLTGLLVRDLLRGAPHPRLHEFRIDRDFPHP